MERNHLSHPIVHCCQWMYCCSLCVDYGRPTLKDLYNHVVQESSVKWRDIGVQLLNPPSDSVLDIIEKDNPRDIRGCCKYVLQKWLNKNPDASWDQLLEALRSPSVELDYLAEQIEHKLIVNKITSKNIIYVTGFANRALSLTSSSPTSTTHNFVYNKVCICCH